MSRPVTVALAGAVIILLGTAVFAFRRAREPLPFPTAPREQQGTPRASLARIGMATLTVEVARTPAEWARGLSGRDTLPPDTGMLFLFPARAAQAFWMKDTLIPLDIIWVRDGRVVGVAAEAQPESGVADEDLRRYTYPGPVDLVIEANGGWARTSGVRLGDAVLVQ